MTLWRALSICYIVVFCIIIAIHRKIKVSKKRLRIIFVLFSFSLAVLSYYMVPPANWDITRHASYVASIRRSGISLFSFVFERHSIPMSSSFSGLYTFNTLCYIAAHVSDNNYFISALIVFMDYIIVGYIMIDWSESNSSPNAFSTLTFLVLFAFLPYIFVSSGLRNALSACLIGLGIYLYLYKEKGIIPFAILSVLAMTVHPASLMTIPFVFIAKLNIGVVGYASILGVTVASKALAIWMSTSSILYFRKIGQKYFLYTSEEQYRGTRVLLYTVIIMIIMYLAVYFLINMAGKSNGADKKAAIINRFLAIYMIYILGNIGNYDMVVRPAYVIGPLSSVYCSFVFDGLLNKINGLNYKQRRLIKLGVIAVFFFLLLYVQIRIMPEALNAFVFNR